MGKNTSRFVRLALALVLVLTALPAYAFGQTTDNGAEAEGLLVFYGGDELALQSETSESNKVNDALAAAGIAVSSEITSIDGHKAAIAYPTAGQTVDEAVNQAMQVDGVVAAQPNYTYELVSDGEAGEAKSGDSAALSNGLDADGTVSLLSAIAANDPWAQYATTGHAPNQYWLYNTGLVRAWDRQRANGSVTVAVLDSAVDASHEDLAANVLSDYAYDAIQGQPLDATEDDLNFSNGHGTDVAGIISAVANNGIGIAGGSFNAKILPVMAINRQSTSTANVLRGLNYILDIVQHGNVPNIRVVNMSLRMRLADSHSGGNAIDTAVERTIEELRNYGVVTVCAGGNETDGVVHTQFTFPADDDACVAVTALTSSGGNWSGSDYNRFKDISAPGVGVWSTSMSTNTYGRYWDYLAGTSQAAPMVSAAFALLFAENPNATVYDACEAIYNTAGSITYNENDATDRAREVESGTHGALQADAALDYLPGHSLSDVLLKDWYYGAVDFVSQKGIMTGYSDGFGNVTAFGPNDALTRGQAATLLWRYAGQPEASDCNKDDVNQGAYYAHAVNWAIASGVMSGYGGTNSFGPNDSLTREQAAKIIANVADADVNSADPTAFNALRGTGDTMPTLKPYVVWAVDESVISGVTNPDGSKSLAPKGTVTRAQMARIMQNAIMNGVL